jgi:hypothetical protein
VADLSTGAFAQAGQSFGFSNIVSSSVTASGAGSDPLSVGNAAVSVTDIADGALSLRLTHDFAPSVTDNLYAVDVLIENTGAGAVGNLVYRRAMDWDVPDTEFSEVERRRLCCRKPQRAARDPLARRGAERQLHR